MAELSESDKATLGEYVGKVAGYFDCDDGEIFNISSSSCSLSGSGRTAGYTRIRKSYGKQGRCAAVN